MIVDSIFWWVGCLVSFGAAVFVCWFLWAFIFDQVFRSLKAQTEFVRYLMWKRKQKIKRGIPDNPNPPPIPTERNNKLAEVLREALTEGRSGGWAKESPLDNKVESLLAELNNLFKQVES